jgi:hypothetical protein
MMCRNDGGFDDGVEPDQPASRTGGRIQERLAVGHVFGAWSERVNSVNTLIDCLAHPVSETARVIGAVAKGTFRKAWLWKLTVESWRENSCRTAKTVNTMVNQLGAFASEVNRVARRSRNGRKAGRPSLRSKGVAGTWKDLTDNVNLMAANLTSQVRNIATVTTAGGERRLDEKDYGGRARRISRAQRHDQHDGGPVAFRSHLK